MRLLRWESWCAILAFFLTLVYVWLPGPYPMAIFTFVAQPLFAAAGIRYLVQVFREARRGRIL
ncbi:MAG TPA: hypothetical protein VFQ91_28300 [Bryobacteraceae bacterium]|nr:hypothetical protein [Bryobacteraceae bacterium]